MTRARLFGCAGVALFGAAPAHADYLEIRRSAELKAEPVRESRLVARLEPGALVALASETQQNGYYAVRNSDGERGFVYRTLVRRQRGDLPVRESESEPVSEAESEGERTPAESDAPVAALRIHVIDVGQGAATLLEFSCGAVLVDTGGELNGEFDSADALRAYLDAFFERRPDLQRTLDGVFITHPHIDHVRNARLVADEYTIRNVVTDGLTSSSGGRQQAWLQDWAREHAVLETVTAGDVEQGGSTSGVIDAVDCDDGDPRLSVLWGALEEAPAEWSHEAFENANNHSLVLRVELGRASFLVSGDLESEGIEALLDKHWGTPALDVDVWQVGHHGSHNATTVPLLDALSPKIALLSTGAPSRQVQWSAWQYGHPRQSVIELLLDELTRKRRAVHVPVATRAKAFDTVRLDEAIYATGWEGSIVVSAKRDGTYRVVTER